MTSKEVFSFSLLLYSMLVIGGISVGIFCYCILSTTKKLKKRNEIVQIENELSVILFQLGYQLKTGVPIENAIKNIRVKIKDLKISEMFDVILRNIEMFGMNFEQAVLDKKSGAVNFYPSRLIKAIMRAIVEISKSGMKVLSKSMITISNYLKNIHAIEEYLKETLSDVVSTMRIQALILAPLSSGIVVALTAMMMHMLINLTEWVESFQAQLGTYGPMGSIGGGIFGSIIAIDKIVPIPYFQIIVGIYMVEIVAMLSIFLSLIQYGEEKIQRTHDLGKISLIAFVIYSFTVVLLYLILTSLTSLVPLT